MVYRADPNNKQGRNAALAVLPEVATTKAGQNSLAVVKGKEALAEADKSFQTNNTTGSGFKKPDLFYFETATTASKNNLTVHLYKPFA